MKRLMMEDATDMFVTWLATITIEDQWSAFRFPKLGPVKERF